MGPGDIPQRITMHMHDGITAWAHYRIYTSRHYQLYRHAYKRAKGSGRELQRVNPDLHVAREGNLRCTGVQRCGRAT